MQGIKCSDLLKAENHLCGGQLAFGVCFQLQRGDVSAFLLLATSTSW
jgi:hypothetical protein